VDQIKAFVAHSFSPEDTGVVNAILEILNRVTTMQPRFSWNHAEEPEPTAVDEKVLALLEDRNLLIAICTRKERVIYDSGLKKLWPLSKLIGSESEFEWKTSDWIIQEIGLAIGRRMKIILLVEESTRAPGALQGNLERIDFNRAAPEKSFNKLLGMINSLSPKPEGGAPEAQQVIPPAVTERKPEISEPESRTIPKSDWTIVEYKDALWHLVLNRDFDGIVKLRGQFYSSQCGANEYQQAEFDSHHEYLLICLDESGDLSRIEALAEKAKGNLEVSIDLAVCYSKLEENVKAGKLFEDASNLADDENRKIFLLGRSAFEFQKGKIFDEVVRLQSKMRERVAKTGVGELRLLEAEKQIAEAKGDGEAVLAILERRLEMNPTNTNDRFSLAYKYSELDRDELAAYHYSRIGYNARNGSTWNNLGVSYSRLKLPIRAISAYRKAEEMGETLAMSNLSHDFLRAGFLSEAEEIIKAALKMDGHHENVDKALGIIMEAKEGENVKEVELFEKVKPNSNFYRAVGRALALPTAQDLNGSWKSPRSWVEIKVSGQQFFAHGEYEASSLGVLASIAAGAIRRESSPHKYTEVYEGEIRGCAIFGTVMRKKEGDSNPTILGSAAETKVTVVMWVNAGGDKIYVLERSGHSDPKQYELVRL